MDNFKKPIRTCISCRAKFAQKELLRLQCKDNKLISFDNVGRSFYICKQCQEKVINGTEIKPIEKALFRQCRRKDEYIVQLKEIITNVR